MKKTIVVMTFLLVSVSAFCQNDLISNIFNKYSGKEGFTTVSITGDMLKLMTQAEQERRDTVFNSKLTEVKILALEKNSCDQVPAIDLRTEVYDKLDKSVYKEMINVKQSNEDVVIMMKETNGHISEILIIAGGKSDNALIQVKGDLLLSEMAELAGKYPMQGFEHFRKL
jgi:hypothetical protein